jgi:hypothetical protein
LADCLPLDMPFDTMDVVVGGKVAKRTFENLKNQQNLHL